MKTSKNKIEEILKNQIKLEYVLDILESKKKNLIKYQNRNFVNFNEEIEVLDAVINDLKGRYSK